MFVEHEVHLSHSILFIHLFVLSPDSECFTHSYIPSTYESACNIVDTQYIFSN